MSLRLTPALGACLGGAAALVLGLGAARANRITSSPRFCGLCHEMRFEVASFSVSAHRGIRCVDCHAGPGTFGWLQHAASGIRSFAGHVGGKRPRAAADVRDDRCLDCHFDLLSRTLEREETRVSHAVFREAGERCVFCHRQLVHAPQPLTASGVPPAGSQAASGAPRDAGTKPAKRVSSVTCLQCHEASSCQSCHGLPMPHPKDWLAVHGRQDPHPCHRCHQQRFCEYCHGVPMPHPEGWRKGHAKATTKRGTCYRCHEEAGCRGCHEAHASHGR